MSGISTRVRTILGGVDANGLIKLRHCDLQSLKQIAVTVFVSLFSLFQRQLLISTVMQTVDCSYCDMDCGKRHQSDSKFISCETSAIVDSPLRDNI